MKPSKKDEEAILFRFKEEENIKNIGLTEENFHSFFEAYAPEAEVQPWEDILDDEEDSYGFQEDDPLAFNFDDDSETLPQQEQIERKLEVIIERFINQRKKQWRKRTM